MSALGSSVINKSGKKFAPKAPARRPVSTQPSVRQSVDRQIQSQTPQPQDVSQQLAASSTISTSLPSPPLSQQQITAAPAKTAYGDESIPVSKPSREARSLDKSSQQPRTTSSSDLSQTALPQANASSVPVLAQKIPLGSQQVSGSKEIIHPFSSSDLSGSVVSSTTTGRFGTTDLDVRNARASGRESQRSTPVDGSATVVCSSGSLPHDDIQLPAAKRRRVEEGLQTSQPEEPSAAEADLNVPILSTEPNDVSVEKSRGTDAENVPEGTAKTKKSRVSAPTKRKQQIQDAATEVTPRVVKKKSANFKKPRKNAKGKDFQRPDAGRSGERPDASADVSGQTEQAASSAKPKRKVVTRKRNQSAQEAAAEIVEDAVQGSSAAPKKRGRKSKREVTPEGADAIVISPAQVKMSDLCKDSRTGRKSEREKDLQEIDRVEFVRKKQKELQEIMGQTEPENAAESVDQADVRPQLAGRQAERQESVANNVPNTIIVNGQIQIDEASLQIDRHANAAAEREAEELDAIEETELTRKVNSFSWLKRDKSGGWNELLTEKFYEGLRMFGTDFEMISKMFPGRSRHKIKLKFVKEEKLNHDKIKATLLGEKLPVDLPEFEKMAGFEVDDPKELEREMEEDRKRLEEETLAEKQALDDARNEREAQIAAERAAAGEESSAKENQRGKVKRKKREKQRRDRSNSTQKGKRANRTNASDGADVAERA